MNPIIIYMLSILQSGPVVQVRVGIATEDLPFREHVPDPVEVTAMIDTGAGRTFIDRSIADHLGLATLETQEFQTVDSHYTAEMCRVNIQIESTPPLDIVVGTTRHQGCKCLIGRDILTRAVFTYDGLNNSFTLLFK